MDPKGTQLTRSVCMAGIFQRCCLRTCYAMEEGIALVASADMVSDMHCPLSSKECAESGVGRLFWASSSHAMPVWRDKN